MLGQGTRAFKMVVPVATSPVTIPPSSRTLPSLTTLDPCHHPLAISVLSVGGHVLFRTTVPETVATAWGRPAPRGISAHVCGAVHGPLQLPAVRAACRKGHYRSQGRGAVKTGAWRLAPSKGASYKVPRPHSAAVWGRDRARSPSCGVGKPRRGPTTCQSGAWSRSRSWSQRENASRLASLSPASSSVPGLVSGRGVGQARGRGRCGQDRGR